MKRPDFFIVGAPKCGTSSLAAWLSGHPRIYMPTVKEPQFFNRDGYYKMETVEEYEALFSRAGPEHTAVGEASTHYLYSRQAVPMILEYNLQARFIVCVRNPVEMAQALHAERVWQGGETVRRFEDAWRLQATRREGKHIPRTLRMDPERLQYGAYCRLGEQLARFYSHVSKDRALVLLLDDLAEDPRREYLKVLAFLGVPDDGRMEFPVRNPRKSPRSMLVAYAVKRYRQVKKDLGVGLSLGLTSVVREHNWRPPAKDELSPELRSELKAYFGDDVRLLEKLLNRDLSGWLR